MARAELRSRHTLDNSDFENKMRQSERTVGRVAGELKSAIAGSFATQAIAQFTRHIADTVDRWDDVADQLGTTRENVQRLEAAFLEAGLSADQAVAAALKLSSAIDNGDDGTLARLGITFDMIRSKGGDMVEMLRMVAVELSKMDRAQARIMARDLFGEKGGEKMLAAMSKLATGNPAIASEGSVSRLAGVGDEFSRMKRSGTAASVNEIDSALGDSHVRSAMRIPIPGLTLGTAIAKSLARKLSSGMGTLSPLSMMRGGGGPGLPDNPNAVDETGRMSDFRAGSSNRAAFERQQALLRQEREVRSQLEALKPTGGGNSPGLNQLQRIGGGGGGFGDSAVKTNLEAISRKQDATVKKLDDILRELQNNGGNFG